MCLRKGDLESKVALSGEMPGLPKLAFVACTNLLDELVFVVEVNEIVAFHYSAHVVLFERIAIQAFPC